MASMALPPSTQQLSWSHLPQELLCLIIDRLPQSSSDDRGGLLSAARSLVLGFLPFAAAHRAHLRETCRTRHADSIDRARFRAVCRSWKAAVSGHAAGTPPRWVPWAVLSDGSLLTPDGAGPLYRLPTFPENARCLGSTDGWLAVDRLNSKKRHRYYLHNPFTCATVPLRELRGIIGKVSRLFKVHKVLMRSTPADVVALVTNNWNYPIILIRPGKGMWLPKPRSPPYVYIIDVAFLGDKLYGITQALDLVSLDIAFDVDGIPTVTGIDRLIRHDPSMDYDFHVWDDNEEDGEYERKRATDAEANEEDEDRRALYERRRRTGDSMILEAIECWDDEEVPYEPKDIVTVSWHLLESCGKLLMVRRQLQIPENSIKFTRKVEVFEANVSGGEWVPVANGLDGQAVFISRRFCKSIPARKDVERDAIYFIDTGEIFNMGSQTMSRSIRHIDHRSSTWIFSSELVV